MIMSIGNGVQIEIDLVGLLLHIYGTILVNAIPATFSKVIEA